MKQLTHAFCLLATATAMFTSCLNPDEKTVTLYDDAAIATFTLGTLSRYYQPASNPDTTLRTTFAGSTYKMTIDHLAQRIYNQDSLPMGTVARALCTVTTVNSGVIGLQGLGEDTLYHYFNSKDSVDFSQPRRFRVVSTDGSFVRDYTVTLNISTTTGNTFGWQPAGQVALPEGRTMADCTPVVLGGTPTVVPYSHVVVWDSLAYRLEGTQLMRSADAETWEVAASADGIARLLGASSHELYALGTNDSIMMLRKGSGNQWVAERLDDRADRLPATDMACVSFAYAPSDSTDYVLLMGNSASTTDTSVTLWRKIAYYTEPAEHSQWVYIPKDPENRYQLPRQTGLSVVCHDGCLLALGSDMKFYRSDDQGITWRENSDYQLPSSFTASSATMLKGDDDTIWLVTSDGQLWSGRKR